MNKLDKIALLSIAIISFVIISVIFLARLAPITITCQISGNCTQVSPFVSAAFEFSHAVRPDMIDELWRTSPDISGKWEWTDQRHAIWRSTSPLAAGRKITIQFVPGAAGQNGEYIRETSIWEVTVRQPRILAINIEGDDKELFSLGLEEGDHPVQLTKTNEYIYDFDPSPDGEKIVYSLNNDQNGLDLWIVRRDGSDQRILLDCGADRCSAPEWSPDLREIAYSRENAGLEPDGPKGAPRIWILEVRTGQTAPIFNDSQQVGYGANWSPDGQWITTWDGTGGGLKVVNRNTNDIILLESNSGELGSWTPDSRYLYYSSMDTSKTGYQSVVYRADISNGSRSVVLGGGSDTDGQNVSHPISNPLDGSFIVSIKKDPKKPDQALGLIHADLKGWTAIIDDPQVIPSYYSWSPDGRYLVFQSIHQGSTENKEEIWVWDQVSSTSIRISGAYRFPKWLP